MYTNQCALSFISVPRPAVGTGAAVSSPITGEKEVFLQEIFMAGAGPVNAPASPSLRFPDGLVDAAAGVDGFLHVEELEDLQYAAVGAYHGDIDALLPRRVPEPGQEADPHGINGIDLLEVKDDLFRPGTGDNLKEFPEKDRVIIDIDGIFTDLDNRSFSLLIGNNQSIHGTPLTLYW